MYREYTDPEKLDTDPHYQFFNQCVQKNVIALPILGKISNRKLYLHNYLLNEGLCESLGYAFKFFPLAVT